MVDGIGNSLEEAESFLKYLVVGIVKTFLTLFMLWLFIDYLQVPHRTITRIFVLVTIFFLTHIWYKKIGYAK